MLKPVCYLKAGNVLIPEGDMVDRIYVGDHLILLYTKNLCPGPTLLL